jgi:hypothetical protein
MTGILFSEKSFNDNSKGTSENLTLKLSPEFEKDIENHTSTDQKIDNLVGLKTSSLKQVVKDVFN